MNRLALSSLLTIGLLAVVLRLPAQDVIPEEVTPEPFVSGSGVEFDAEVTDRLQVRAVTPESFAATANLKPGDVIVSIDDRPFATADEVETYLTTLEGRPARFLILRDGQEESLVYLAPTTELETYTIPRPKYGQPAGIGVRIAGSHPVTVIGVYEGSPADVAGILPGDHLLAVDGIEYGSVTPIVAAIAQHGAGEDVSLTIRRGEVEQLVIVEPQAWELAFDEEARILPGWEVRQRRSCYRYDDDFALYDDLNLYSERGVAVELAALRAEVRALHQQLIETNARLEALQIESLRPAEDVAAERDVVREALPQ